MENILHTNPGLHTDTDHVEAINSDDVLNLIKTAPDTVAQLKKCTLKSQQQ